MRTVVEPLEGNKVKLTVQIEDSELDRALDQAARKLAREVRMPGFRPGKVPRRVLEARLGSDTLRQEALREALPDFYASALRESDVDAIAPPEIDITAGQETGPVAFDAVVEVRPTVAIPGYEGLQITLERPDATPEELSRQIDRLRNNDAVLTEVTRPAADGDNVTINLATTRAGEPVDGLTADDFLYEVGSEAVVPELDQHLRGAGVGDILKFSATVPNGEVLELEVLVKDVKEKVLPEITDEWAGEASEFSTVAELEDDLRTRIETIKRAQVGMQLRDHALAALVELVADDPPEALVEAEVERRLHDMAHRLQTQGATLEQYLEATGTDSQALLGELRTGAVESVKADLALRAICEAEGLEDEEADVEAEIARLAESVGRSAAQVRRNLVSADQMPAVRSDVRKAKALSWLIDHVSVVDPQGQPIDRADLEPRPAITESTTEASADTEAEDHGAEAIPEETKS
jgi:trigger factor